MAQALWLAAERIAGVQIGVIVNLNKRFEADAQALAVIEDAAVVIGNAPGSGIEVKVLVETAGVLTAAEFGKAVATAQRPAAPTPTVVIRFAYGGAQERCGVAPDLYFGKVIGGGFPMSRKPAGASLLTPGRRCRPLMRLRYCPCLRRSSRTMRSCPSRSFFMRY